MDSSNVKIIHNKFRLNDKFFWILTSFSCDSDNTYYFCFKKKSNNYHIKIGIVRIGLKINLHPQFKNTIEATKLEWVSVNDVNSLQFIIRIDRNKVRDEVEINIWTVIVPWTERKSSLKFLRVDDKFENGFWSKTLIVSII